MTARLARSRAALLAVLALLHFVLLAGPGPAGAEGPVPAEGMKLPPFTIQDADRPEDRAYLGLKAPGPFGLKDIEAELVFVEIAGVYCPICHNQAPRLNQLFARVQKSKELSSKVKFLVLAPGTPMEIDYLRKKFEHSFPILNDVDFAIHKKLGEPKTPFTMLVRRDGTVVFTHLGAIEDMDALFQKIKSLAQ